MTDSQTPKVVVFILISITWTICLQLVADARPQASSLESMSEARRAVFNKILDKAANESQMDPLELLRMGLEYHREKQFKEMNWEPLLAKAPKANQQAAKVAPPKEVDHKVAKQAQVQTSHTKPKDANLPQFNMNQEHPKNLLAKITGGSKGASELVEQVTQEPATGELTSEDAAATTDTLETVEAETSTAINPDLISEVTSQVAAEATTPILSEDSASTTTTTTEAATDKQADLEATTRPVTTTAEELPATSSNLIIAEPEPTTTTTSSIPETVQTASATEKPTQDDGNQFTFETSTSGSKPELLDVEIEPTTPSSPTLDVKTPITATHSFGPSSGAVSHRQEEHEQEEEEEEFEEKKETSKKNIKRKFKKTSLSPLTTPLEPFEPFEPMEPFEPLSVSSSSFRQNNNQQQEVQEDQFGAKSWSDKSEEDAKRPTSSKTSPEEQVKVEDKTYIDRSDPRDPKRVKVISRSKSSLGKDGIAKREHHESRVITSLAGAPGSDPSSFTHHSTSTSHFSSSSSSSSKKSTQKTSSNNNGFESFRGFGRMSAPSASMRAFRNSESGFGQAESIIATISPSLAATAVINLSQLARTTSPAPPTTTPKNYRL